MKMLLILLTVLLAPTLVFSATLTVDDFYHNPLVLDAKNITLYRKLGCIFDNKFYSEGTVLKFADGNRQCIYKNDRYYWDR